MGGVSYSPGYEPEKRPDREEIQRALEASKVSPPGNAWTARELELERALAEKSAEAEALRKQVTSLQESNEHIVGGALAAGGELVGDADAARAESARLRSVIERAKAELESIRSVGSAHAALAILEEAR